MPNFVFLRALGCIAQRSFLKRRNLNTVHRLCTVADDNSITDTTEDLDSIRNISGLPDKLRNRMKHVEYKLDSATEKPYKNIKEERDAMRKLYATFGSKSGVDPRVMWDTKQEYLENIAQDLMQPSLEEAKRRVIRSKRLEEERIEQTVKNVKIRVEKILPSMIEDHLSQHYGVQATKTTDETKAADAPVEAKKDKPIKKKKVTKEPEKPSEDEMLQQAREFLGYDINKRDPEFRAYLQKVGLEKFTTRTVRNRRKGKKDNEDDEGIEESGGL